MEDKRNPRAVFAWYIYDWETRSKRVVLDPPTREDLAPGEIAYFVNFTLDPPLVPLRTQPLVLHATEAYARPEWSAYFSKPLNMSIAAWVAYAIFVGLERLVPPFSFGPGKPLESWIGEGDKNTISHGGFLLGGEQYEFAVSKREGKAL